MPNKSRINIGTIAHVHPISAVNLIHAMDAHTLNNMAQVELDTSDDSIDPDLEELVVKEVSDLLSDPKHSSVTIGNSYSEEPKPKSRQVRRQEARQAAKNRSIR